MDHIWLLGPSGTSSTASGLQHGDFRVESGYLGVVPERRGPAVQELLRNVQQSLAPEAENK